MDIHRKKCKSMDKGCKDYEHRFDSDFDIHWSCGIHSTYSMEQDNESEDD